MPRGCNSPTHSLTHDVALDQYENPRSVTWGFGGRTVNRTPDLIRVMDAL